MVPSLSLRLHRPWLVSCVCLAGFWCGSVSCSQSGCSSPAYPCWLSSINSSPPTGTPAFACPPLEPQHLPLRMQLFLKCSSLAPGPCMTVCCVSVCPVQLLWLLQRLWRPSLVPYLHPHLHSQCVRGAVCGPCHAKLKPLSRARTSSWVVILLCLGVLHAPVCFCCSDPCSLLRVCLSLQVCLGGAVRASLLPARLHIKPGSAAGVRFTGAAAHDTARGEPLGLRLSQRSSLVTCVFIEFRVYGLCGVVIVVVGILLLAS